MYVMVKEIHHHLGLDGVRIIFLRERQDRIEKDILQWREKQAKKNL